jgi:hypothetical protein
MSLIHGDVIRTVHHIYCLPSLPLAEGEPVGEPLAMFGGHLRKMERVLYTLSMVNRALGYNQGFNELLQPFYNVLFNSRHLFGGDEMVVECLTFQLLLRLLNVTRLFKLFVIGTSTSSIINELGEFSKLLQCFIPTIAARLESLDLQPVCYCYRWFSLLFAQEFEMPNVMTIWDRVLAHAEDITRYVFLVGIGFLKCWEGDIPTMDHPGFLAKCQVLRPQDIPAALDWADATWDKL